MRSGDSMRTQSPPMNEQYWRDRYGMPPRTEEAAIAGRRPRMVRRRRLAVHVTRFHSGSRRRFGARLAGVRPGRGVLLKASAALLCAIWLAGSLAFLLRGTPPEAPVTAALASRVLPLAAALGPADPKPDVSRPGVKSEDAMIADFAAANEASLIALRGFILTGSDGFQSEWQRSLTRLDATEGALLADSRSWTDGARLLQLAELRGTSRDLVAQEKVLAELVGTPNRFPGLRLYKEDVDPALAEVVALCDRTLQSIMASKWAGTTQSVDALARLRGHVRVLREGLATYLPSVDKIMPPELQSAHLALREAAATIAGIRGKVSPADQAALDRLATLLVSSDDKLAQVLALKQTPRWDYADYAFRQKVLPLAERISAIVGEWRAAS